mmetsp:Transcript_40571/g.98639  ORF Transcript_40571/g.98639 Transcript_40571/m.98639 type:complete len:303 (-) Transcript_40571:200-1108(-)
MLVVDAEVRDHVGDELWVRADAPPMLGEGNIQVTCKRQPLHAQHEDGTLRDDVSVEPLKVGGASVVVRDAEARASRQPRHAVSLSGLVVGPVGGRKPLVHDPELVREVLALPHDGVALVEAPLLGVRAQLLHLELLQRPAHARAVEKGHKLVVEVQCVVLLLLLVVRFPLRPPRLELPEKLLLPLRRRQAAHPQLLRLLLLVPVPLPLLLQLLVHLALLLVDVLQEVCRKIPRPCLLDGGGEPILNPLDPTRKVPIVLPLAHRLLVLPPPALLVPLQVPHDLPPREVGGVGEGLGADVLLAE